MNNEKESSFKALVVDDNEINLLMLTHTLNLFEIQTDCASSGLEALSICGKKIYDMIFIDHMMPEMDGLQTTEAIGKILPKACTTAIIILTAEITEELRHQYLTAGANKVLIKPLIPENITELLQQYNFENRVSTNRTEVNTINPIVKIETSLRDVQKGMNHIISGIETNSSIQQLLGTHKLINVFISLGETRLLEKTKVFEKMITEGKADHFYKHCNEYITELVDYIITIYTSIQAGKSTAADITDEYITMSSGEYEQSLINAIYYIKRFEYDFIIRELQHLIQYGWSRHKQELETAIKEVGQYQYERALLRILDIKKMTGNLPVPDIKKQTKLECFWE